MERHGMLHGSCAFHLRAQDGSLPLQLKEPSCLLLRRW
jgi:hypothetical protein